MHKTRKQVYYANTNEIVGKIPPYIIGRGNAIIFISFVILIAISCIITYPEKIVSEAIVYYSDNKYKASALIPSYELDRIAVGQKVIVKLKCMPKSAFGHMSGTVSTIIPHLKNNAYPIKIDIEKIAHHYSEPNNHTSEMTAQIEIIVAMQPYILKFIKPLK